MSAEDVTVTKPPTIGAALAKKHRSPEAVLEHIAQGDDLITGMGNSEPATVLDAIEAQAERLSGVRIHQMFPFRERRYMHGHFPGLRHVSWFLSPASREAFHKGTCDLVPNSFSEVPSLMRRSTRCSLVLASVSPPDSHRSAITPGRGCYDLQERGGPRRHRVRCGRASRQQHPGANAQAYRYSPPEVSRRTRAPGARHGLCLRPRERIPSSMTRPLPTFAA